MNRLIEHGLHPVALVGSIGLFLALGAGPLAALATFLALQTVLVATSTLIIIAIGFIGGLQETGWAALGMMAPADGISSWPIAVQVVVLYFGTDFIYYWIHRGIHCWPWLWRASGHGVHHAFHRLHAAHAGLTHPFEFVLLAAPMTLWVIFASPAQDAVLLATVLLLSNSMLAHCNLRMATPGLSWFLTTSEQHRRHHSAVFVESNSNYACNAILWDRLFGTYGGGTTAATGIGPRQPNVRELLRMPFREPDDAETVANQRRG